VLGLETEYALVSSAPCPQLAEELLQEAIAGEPVARTELKGGCFLSNGSLIHLESSLIRTAGRLPLPEVATAECSSPLELLAHARAATLRAARAAAALREKGHDLSVFRASRDLLGRTWGSHENYLVRQVHSPLARAAWFVVIGAADLQLRASLGVVSLARRAVQGALPRATRRSQERVGMTERLADRLTAWCWSPMLALVVNPFCRALAYRPQRGPLFAHLSTRTIFTGAGALSLAPGYPLLLRSGRALAIRRLMGISQLGRRKPAIDPKPYLLDPGAVRRPWRRLHVGTGESTRMDVAGWLRLGTTWLLLEAVERGGRFGPLELLDPLAELRRVSIDGPRARVRLADGRIATALEHQQALLGEVRRTLGPDGGGGEIALLLERWERVLTQLAAGDDAALARQLDFHAKQRLLRGLAREERADEDRLRRLCAAYGPLVRHLAKQGGSDAEPDHILTNLSSWGRRRLSTRLQHEGLARVHRAEDLALVLAAVKIDLRYHELGRGYHDVLATNGDAEELVSFETVRTALARPPAVPRARERGRRIREREDVDHATWDATYDTKGRCSPLPELE
jgi:hypothetical protein